MPAYYNEIEPFAAQWLRNLIAAGLIAPGDVDDRSITEVRADDLRGYTQCHFFAGIGIWSHALRLAGWPDDRPVWTGSAPCQPFSQAGRQKADEDDRHLAPVWLRLIGECRPPVVFGEQVGAAIRVGWLDALFTEMEAMHYACGAVDFPACSVGAPHIRQRLYFVADSRQEQRGRRPHERRSDGEGASERHEEAADYQRCGATGGIVGDTKSSDREVSVFRRGSQQAGVELRGTGRSGFWSDCDWLPCIDGKARPVEPGTFPLAHGAAARMGFVCATCLETSEEGQDDENVPVVQQIPCETQGRLAQEVLQQEVHGGGVHQNTDEQRSGALSGAAPIPGEGVRGLRQDGELSAPSPQGREPQKQRTGEHQDSVRELPREGTRADACILCGAEADWLAEAYLRGNRVGRLRAYGNAIVAPQATEFIKAYMECRL